MHLTYPDLDGHMWAASPTELVEAGAPETEIEITPEMIEAGAGVLCRFETFTADEEYWAKEVYRSMRAVAP